MNLFKLLQEDPKVFERQDGIHCILYVAPPEIYGVDKHLLQYFNPSGLNQVANITLWDERLVGQIHNIYSLCTEDFG